MRGWLALLLIAPLLSGCLSFLDDDDGPDDVVGPASDVDNPDDVRIDGVAVHNHPTDGGGQDRIVSFDGTELPYVIYEPLASTALPNGDAPRFPVVVFLHGWGMSKEMWLCPPMGDPGQPALPDDPCPFENFLQRFAESGFISVAYDARGFGQAGGQSTLAGGAEMADLDAVLDFVLDGRFPTNGKVGVTGISYGGGQSLQAWATNGRVTTVAAHQGWTDLYEALLPGNVPKGEWSALLLGEGTITSGASLHPMIYEWAADAVQRTNLGDIRAGMDARSIGERGVAKPLLVCNAMQDTLFTQTQQMLELDSTFTRAVVHAGGHGSFDPDCWDKTEDWFLYFLRGVDTGVDGWPAFETVDVAGGDLVSYDAVPDVTSRAYYLREPQLTTYDGSNATFTIEQRVANNPLQEPGAVWDLTGRPNEALPFSMREDPSAVFFESAPMAASEVLLGAPHLTLRTVDADQETAFQVAVQLLSVTEGGDSRILSRGAYAYVPGQVPAHNGTVEVDLHYTKADLEPGTRLVLKVGGNDVSWFLPFFNGNDPATSNYGVTFTGHSQLDVPFYN